MFVYGVELKSEDQFTPSFHKSEFVHQYLFEYSIFLVHLIFIYKSMISE